MTEFPLPLPARPQEYGYARAITAGPDGNMWFTRPELQKIGRITTSGQIAEFALPGASDGKPEGIAAGPDGNLWFTEGSGDAIGRVTTAGEVSELPLPIATGQQPNAIVVGPDGNVWFTESGANRIGRITPAGAIAEFPVPTLGGTREIAAGPRGEVWFTSLAGVGSISPGGRATPLLCIDSSCDLPPLSLMASAGGELWLGTANRILGYGGGYTTMLAAVNEPGYLARLVSGLTLVIGNKNYSSCP